MAFESVVFVQQVRTASSEVWLADESRASKEVVAQIDIHYPGGGVDVTVSFLRPVKDEDLTGLLDLIDDELISATEAEKGNLRFRVVRGGKNTVELFRQERKADDQSLDFLGGLGNG